MRLYLVDGFKGVGTACCKLEDGSIAGSCTASSIPAKMGKLPTATLLGHSLGMPSLVIA